MKIYQLTQFGKRLARTTNNPDTPGWRVIHALDAINFGTIDQIALQAGVSEEETAAALGALKRKSTPVVEEH